MDCSIVFARWRPYLLHLITSLLPHLQTALDRPAVFAGLSVVSNTQTDRQTDRPRYVHKSVAIARIYAPSAGNASNNNNNYSWSTAYTWHVERHWLQTDRQFQWTGNGLWQLPLQLLPFINTVDKTQLHTQNGNSKSHKTLTCKPSPYRPAPHHWFKRESVNNFQCLTLTFALRPWPTISG